MKDKGFIFTMDAILGLIPVFIVIASVSSVGISGTVFLQRQSMVLNHITDDSLASLDKLGTLDAFATMWANYTFLASPSNPNQNITRANIEQQKLITLINDTFDHLIPTDYGYRLRIGPDTLVDRGGVDGRPTEANSSGTSASFRLATGFRKEQPVLGCVASAFLEKIVSKTTTKLVYMPPGWGSYEGNFYGIGGGISNATIERQFELPDDAQILNATMYYAPDTQADQFFIFINGNDVLDGSQTIFNRQNNPVGAHEGGGGNVYKVNVPANYLQNGTNNMTFVFSDNGNYMTHMHPGSFLEITYNTSEPEAEALGDKTFYGIEVTGSPAANQMIPFFVDGTFNRIFIHVVLNDVNKFVLITANYRYDFFDPFNNVILYRFLNSTAGTIPPGIWAFSNPSDGDTIEYNITITNTETTITETLNAGASQTLINPSITLGDFFTDRTNIIGINADINAPNNALSNHCGAGVERDWQQIGQTPYGNDDQGIQETDGFPTGTARIYSDEFGNPGGSTYVNINYNPRVSVPFNFISITRVFDFPGDPATDSTCDASSDQTPSKAEIQFTTPSYDPTEVLLVASQRWGGCDNGYNNVWVGNTTDPEANLVLDVSAPPGTPTFLPVSFFEPGTTAVVRLRDTTDTSGRHPVCGDRSKIFYTFRVPSQVDFGGTYQNCDGSNQTFYFDGDQDGVYNPADPDDGTVTPLVGPNPNAYEPCSDGVDNALWRLLDQLNFINDNVDGGNPCDDTGSFPNTNITSDGNMSNPFDLEIDPNDIRFSGRSIGEVPFMFGPVNIRLEVWG